MDITIGSFEWGPRYLRLGNLLVLGWMWREDSLPFQLCRPGEFDETGYCLFWGRLEARWDGPKSLRKRAAEAEAERLTFIRRLESGELAEELADWKPAPFVVNDFGRVETADHEMRRIELRAVDGEALMLGVPSGLTKRLAEEIAGEAPQGA